MKKIRLKNQRDFSGKALKTLTILSIAFSSMVYSSTSYSVEPRLLKDDLKFEWSENASSLMVPQQKTLTTSRHSKAQLEASIDGRMNRDDFIKSNSLGFRFNLLGERRFSESFTALVDISFFFENGNSSSLYVRDGDPKQEIKLFEAAIQYDLNQAVNLKGGILPIRFSTMPSIFKTSGFLGFQQNFQYKPSQGKTGFIYSFSSSQSIPNASGREEASGSERETPLLLLGSAEVKYKDKRWEYGVGYSQFGFSDLPDNIVSKSSLSGNTVVSPEDDLSSFRYEFQGWQANTDIEYTIDKKWELELAATYIKNIRAPEGKNTGFSVTMGFDMNFGTYEIDNAFQFLYNERDTLPSTYVSQTYGKNNRRAFSYKLVLELPKERIDVYGQWVRTLEIEDLDFTADRNIFLFGIETLYDIL